MWEHNEKSSTTLRLKEKKNSKYNDGCYKSTLAIEKKTAR